MIRIMESYNDYKLEKEKIIDTLKNDMVGFEYRFGAELVKMISQKSGVDYDICFELLKNVIEESNIRFAKSLLDFPLINGGEGFKFSVNYPYCEKIIKQLM